eukprot:CAMPEP_0119073082 /NCGR_PEP_ID=MMETSP1178-20130426/62205_1 /TAXON_ID=33656 /ORGANISM="unid sp, Strain CCMP2000" /LENGTH=35 /DNA_ID= /DNA_START= /DNA_END= /DNA_ORIENTATION=
MTQYHKTFAGLPPTGLEMTSSSKSASTQTVANSAV